MRPTYYDVPFPDFLDNTIEVFNSSNVSLLANVKAAVLQGQPFFRDYSTDVAFLVNETNFISIVPDWTGQPGDLRIEWAEYLSDVVFWCYALHRYKKQWLLICAPAGSPSLTPPVAVDGGGGGGSLGLDFVDGGGAGEIPAGTVAESTDLLNGHTVQMIFNTAPYFQLSQDNFKGFGIESFVDGAASNFIGILEDNVAVLLSSGIEGQPRNYAEISSGAILLNGRLLLTHTIGQGKIIISDGTFLIQDNRGTPLGLSYDSEYPDILSNDRSIPDVGLIRSYLNSRGINVAPSKIFKGRVAVTGIVPSLIIFEDNFENLFIERDSEGLYYINAESSQFSASTNIMITDSGFGDTNTVTYSTARISATQIGIEVLGAGGTPYDPTGFFITIQTYI